MEEKKEEKQQRLNFRIIESTSEDPEHPLFELLKGSQSNGWFSVRFCTFPQDIIIQFLTPVNLTQINLLSHEKKISSLIEFYSYFPSQTNEFYQNFKNLTYEKLGYIRMDTNNKSNHKLREFRKVFINTNCIYLKITLHKNYMNKYNVFNQVGLISIEFYGIPIHINNNDFIMQDSLKPREFNEDLVDEITKDKLRIIRTALDEAIKSEDYDEAKKIKINLDRLKSIGKKIFELEFQKKLHINNEDFDNAKIIKIEIDRLRSLIKNIDKQAHALAPIINSVFENTTVHEIDDNKENKDVLGISNNNINQSFNRSDIVNNSFSMNANDLADANKSVLNKSRVNFPKIEEKDEDEFLEYDDRIIPTIKKKLNPNLSTNDLLENQTIQKGDLEELESSIKSTYEIFIKFIGEEGLCKIFSKQVVYKEEGLEIFQTKMDEMFIDNNINNMINLTMKLIYNLLGEKHPQVCIRSIDMFKKLLEIIKNSKQKLTYDFSITDSILIKINEKLGDVSQKVRIKSVELYSYMLQQKFCDYNNLVSELVKDENRINISKLMKNSSRVVYAKLGIINNLLDDFDKTIAEKRTDINSFPFIAVTMFVVENLNHSKSEIRKLTRCIVTKLKNIFGFKKLEPFLKKVDEKELSKLLPDMIEVAELISKPKKIRSSKGRSLEKKDTTDKTSPSHTLSSCTFCGKQDKKFNIKENLEKHINEECVLFTTCKCGENVEVKNYCNHLLSICKSKDEYKLCKRCKEAIHTNEFQQHEKENKCNPAKNINSSNRCPLCHKDIQPNDKGFIQHLVKDICQKQKRRDKITFVNGK